MGWRCDASMQSVSVFMHGVRLPTDVSGLEVNDAGVSMHGAGVSRSTYDV